MKYNIITKATILFFLGTTGIAHAAQLTGCAAKKNNLETQISYAKKYNNTHRVAGLKEALKQIDENCTDESLKAERMEKVAEKEKKVAERKSDLKEAKETGNTKKITKRERKLQEAIDDLAEAKDELLR